MDRRENILFEKLTPVDDVDISVYESAINFALNQNDIRNIAISGAYGAGKSSVLASYKKKHDSKKFIHISLAHFQNQNSAMFGEPTSKIDISKENEYDNGKETIKENTLEGKILNQLIHQIPPDKIPQSNFRVKKQCSKKEPLIHTGIIAVLFMTLLRILFSEQWTLFVYTLPVNIQQFLSFSTTAISVLASGAICALISCFYLYKIICTQKNKNIFKKLNFQGNEIEIFEDSEDSFFDKYLNEVLYLFKNVDADAIVFEDIDRFEVVGIFERLREINELANKHRENANVYPIKFFYLLRDDIFISKERTKFFDFIIPVIPVVDGSNSYDQFIEHLKKNDIFAKIDEKFLQDLSLYVDDMRILKNICNEFLIYYYRLELTELDYNKMLAIITYKNLFPRDFSDLQAGKGFIYALFDNKPSFVDEEIKSLNKKVDGLTRRITAANEEITKTEKELDIIYDHYNNNYIRSTHYNLGELRTIIGERKQALRDRETGKISEFEDERKKLNDRIMSLANAPLTEILTRENIDYIFENNKTKNTLGEERNYENVKQNEYFDLLKFLIRNGYIDETYADYMTYFYENSLSRTDKIFLRSVADKKAKPIDYELKNPAMVLSRISPCDFLQVETLNLILCDEVLSGQKYNEYLHYLIRQLRENKDYNFISRLFDYTKNESALVNALNSQWDSFFSDVQNTDAFSEEQLKRFSVLTLYYSDDELLQKLDEKTSISQFICSKNDYLDIDEPKVDGLIHAFKCINISFPSIDYSRSNIGLFNAVYINNLYDLNYTNIEMLLINMFGVDDPQYCKEKSYTAICSNCDSPLYKRINSDISAYLEVMFSECGGKISDIEECAIDLLNRDDVDISNKRKYIGCLQTPIVEISSIIDEIVWADIFSSGILVHSEQNIIAYYSSEGIIDNILVEYINKSSKAFNFSEANTGLTEEQRNVFFDNIVSCNSLNDRHYESIITSLGIQKQNFNIVGISESKIEILIRNSIVTMDKNTLFCFRNTYSTGLFSFIRKNIEEYVSLIDSEMLVYDELCAILDWDVADDIKIKLLGFTNAEISVVGRNCSEAVKSHVLKYNLDQRDMESLYYSYGSETKEIKQIILSNAISNIWQLIENPLEIAKCLYSDIFSSSELGMAEKIELLAAKLPDFEEDDVRKFLSILALEEFIKIFDPRSRPRIKKTSFNESLLNAFQTRGWIYDYTDDSASNNYYGIRRRAPRGRG